MKKWIFTIFISFLVLLFSSCGLKDGKMRIENQCSWTITVTVKSDDFSQTETIKSKKGHNFDLELNTTYDIDITDELSSSIWSLSKTTPFMPSTWYISWKNLTYTVK